MTLDLKRITLEALSEICYSFWAPTAKDELSPTIRVPAEIPPLFIVHATDDPIRWWTTA